VTDKLRERLAEVDLTSSLIVLASVEAAFRIDYLQRCYRRGRDPISRAFRSIYQAKQQRASLEDEIFEAWVDNSSGARSIISELRARFDSVIGWRMGATGHPNWDRAMTSTIFTHLPI
jgi:hypothetical protein